MAKNKSPPKKKENPDSRKTKKGVNKKRKPSESLERELGVLPPRRSNVQKRFMASGFEVMEPSNSRLFEMVRSLDKDFDYLVMREYKRTVKALYAICKGILILNYQWLRDSDGLGKANDPGFYHFKRHEFLYEAIEKAQRGDIVFKGFTFNLASEKYHMRQEDIEILVSASGGELFHKSGNLSREEKANDKLVALVRNENKNEEQELKREVAQAKKKGYRHIYQLDFFIDACERQEIRWDIGKLGDDE